MNKGREEALINKLKEMSCYEKDLYNQGHKIVVGVDEVGRGPLAGPVVAAAVVLPQEWNILGLDDSKKLSEKKRTELNDIIINNAICYSVIFIDNVIIDKINILNATKKAMALAIEKIEHKLKKKEKYIDHILIDALELSQIKYPQTGIIKGDTKSISIAAASIIAKVARDRYMIDLHKDYPEYMFHNNKGYGTKAHYEGISRVGITPFHRKSFLKNIKY